MRRGAAVAAALGALPTAARAHSFAAGADQYAQFVEGVAVPLADLRLLLAMIAAGLLLAQRDPAAGLPRAWPLVLVGMLAGLAMGPLVPPAVSTATLAAAAVLGLLAALNPPLRFAFAAALAAMAAALTTATGLEGHAYGEVPLLTQAGILFGANLALAAAAGLASLVLVRLRHPLTQIGLRILASWCVAIALMLIAFELR